MTYRKPWTRGAKAYPEADSYADLIESMKRKRNSYMIHVYTVDADVYRTPCAHCHQPVGDQGPEDTAIPKYAVVTVYPKTRTAVFAHYVCSWSMLFEQIAAIHL